MLQISADGTSNLVRLQSLDYYGEFAEYSGGTTNIIRRGGFLRDFHSFIRDGTESGIVEIHTKHPVPEYRQYHGSRIIGLLLHTYRQ